MDTRVLINTLFDYIKQSYALPSDAALARHLGVWDMYIVRWRRGEFGTSTEVLAPLLIAHADVLRQVPDEQPVI